MDPSKISTHNGLLLDLGQYMRLIGKLIYLMFTHPNISFVVSVDGQYIQNPRKPYFDAILRILRYLKKALGQGLLFRSNEHLDIEGYSDADWISCHDRRSLLEVIVYL